MKNAHRSGTGSSKTFGARSLRAACGAGIAAAALLGTFASISSAHALTVDVGGGITVHVPLFDAGITLPILPSVDAGSVSLPVLGSDAGIVITLPLLPTTDAGTIALPLLGQDGGVLSLPGLGTDAGLALLCENGATCAAGFSCFTELGLCLPETEDGGSDGLGDLTGGGSGADAGSGSGSGSSTTTTTTVTGSGSATVSTGSAGSSADGGTATSSTTGTTADSDAGTTTDGEEPGDQNGVSCSMSPGGSSGTAVPFELLLGFVAFGAMRRRNKRAAR